MVQLTERGSKIGVHAQRNIPQLYEHVDRAVEQGTPIPVLKTTQEHTILKEIKQRSPQTTTVAREVAPMDGMGGVADITNDEVDGWADLVLEPLYEFAANNSGFEDYIDAWEFINEADPEGDQGYRMLGKVMNRCVEKATADFPGVLWGVGSMNAGTPEYDEMKAFAESGVFDHDNVILCLHEGILEEGDPINKWHSSESDHPDAGLIPGAPSVPEHGGALIGRVTYWRQILDDERMPLVIISEAYWRAYDDTEELVRRAAWVDGEYSRLWYVLAALPYTYSPTEQWRKQDYTEEYDALLDYAASVADRQNALPPQEDDQDEPDPPPPPPDPEPRDWRLLVWEHSLEEQEERGIKLNPDFGLQQMIFSREGYTPVTRETTMRDDEGNAYGHMAAEDVSGNGPRITLAFQRPWSGPGGVEVLTKEDLPEPEPEPFAWHAWPTDYRVVTQTVGNNPAYYGRLSPHFEGHEGADIRAPLGESVYAVHSGVVSDLRQAGDKGHPYGKFVRIAHDDGIHETTYGHLQEILVEEGKRVEAGQQIGLADNTGNIVSGSSHLHVTLKRSGVIIDPTPYLLPHNPSFPGLPPAEHGPTITDVSRHQGQIDFHKMMRRGCYGVYIRGSIGAAGRDDAFERNWEAIVETDMSRGIYHLFRSNATARQNLNNIINAVHDHGHGDFRIAVDVEPIGTEQVDGNRVGEFITLFREAFGYECLIYTGLWVLNPAYHKGDKSWITNAPLWLASYWQAPPQVGQFPQLPAGGTLDRLYMHQWTSSYVNEVAWGVESSGLDINVAYNLDRLLVEPVVQDPLPQQIDMAQFFLPPEGQQNGDIIILRNNWSGGEERQQLQREGNTAYVTKNRQWERRTIHSDRITLDMDTSPGDGKFYRVESPTGWMPRRWAPGETFRRRETVRFFRKDNCEQVSQTTWENDLRFAAIHDTYETEGGVSFGKVAEIHWLRNGQVEEWYFYAFRAGLIEWRNRAGRHSWAVERIPAGDQQPNEREVVDCA